MRERLLLQIFVALGGIIPVAAGAAGIFFGPDFVDATVGMAADSHFRYLSGLLLGLGLGFWSTIPRIEANGTRFRLLISAPNIRCCHWRLGTFVLSRCNRTPISWNVGCPGN